jgi:hypothetical protein
LFTSGGMSESNQIIRLKGENTGLTTAGIHEIISLRKALINIREEIIEIPRETAN